MARSADSRSKPESALLLLCSEEVSEGQALLSASESELESESDPSSSGGSYFVLLVSGTLRSCSQSS